MKTSDLLFELLCRGDFLAAAGVALALAFFFLGWLALAAWRAGHYAGRRREDRSAYNLGYLHGRADERTAQTLDPTPDADWWKGEDQ